MVSSLNKVRIQGNVLNKEEDTASRAKFETKNRNPFAVNTARIVEITEESSPAKSFYTSGSPVLCSTQRLYGNFQVFDRLIADTNRRSERELKIAMLKQEKEEKEIRRYTEKERVYQRLLKDTEIRQERKDLREKYKKEQEHKELVQYKSPKRVSKEEAEKIVTRLISNTYPASPQKDADKQYKRLKMQEMQKTESVKTFQIFINGKKLEKHKSELSLSSTCRTLEKNKVPSENPRLSLLERMEIESLYGRPGEPNSCKVSPKNSLLSTPKKLSFNKPSAFLF